MNTKRVNVAMMEYPILASSSFHVSVILVKIENKSQWTLLEECIPFQFLAQPTNVSDTRDLNDMTDRNPLTANVIIMGKPFIPFAPQINCLVSMMRRLVVNELKS